MRCILRPGDEIVDGRAARRPGGRVTGRESRDTAGFALPVSLLVVPIRLSVHGVNTGRAEHAPVVTSSPGCRSGSPCTLSVHTVFGPAP